MEESSKKQEEAQETRHEAPDAAEYVDDLADAADYWLTLTDAARVTRRQEVTIRRWVTSGTLPVRRQRMGVNKRTRHVRASDLAQLTPIIDPTAAITGMPANADLLSIPVQQAHILASHHDLLQQLTQLAQRLMTLQQHLDEQQTHQTTAIGRLHDEIAQRVDHIQAQNTATIAALTQQQRQQQDRQEKKWQQTSSAIAQETAARASADQQQREGIQHIQNALAKIHDDMTHHTVLLADLRVDLTAQVTRLDERADRHEQQIAQNQVELAHWRQALLDLTQTVVQDRRVDEEHYQVLRQERAQAQAEDQRRYQTLDQRIAAFSRRLRQRSRHPKRP